MTFTSDMLAELNLLLKFPNTSLMQGIKVHHDAEPELIAAAKRLFDKGIVTLPDGGYLTDLGHDLVEHAKVIASAFSHPQD
ncbi:TIGR02647 family protein [Paraglaciecola hydrolytica]|uniref:DNA-binding protein n=1 Tax=Paraglaciecola hydrolytica TaxID=1799789 RepID=A0A136A6Z7_9ALTE|nr:TIGR02647 family protein [Paraglaciecola hydrolytica]KXI31015.1 DNA-binding protein [Paraglaciecola hydrolytica]